MPNLHHSLHELPGLDEPKRKCSFPSNVGADEISKQLDALSVANLSDKENSFVDAMLAKLDGDGTFTEAQCDYITDLHDRLCNDVVY